MSTYVVNIYNPSPATSQRPSCLCFESLSSLFAFVETYGFVHGKFGIFGDVPRITSWSDSMTTVVVGDTVMTAIQLPFDLNHEEQAQYETYDEVGQARIYAELSHKKPKTKLVADKPKISVVDGQLEIFVPSFDAVFSDPTQVFTEDFLIGIGYYNQKGGA